MKPPLTDEQILAAVERNMLNCHNGRKCGRVHYENGVGPAQVCEGRAAIVGGRLKYDGTCGEPCSFICDDGQAFQREIDNLLHCARVVDAVRR